MTEEKNEVIFDDDKISKSEEFVNPDELYQELIQCVQKYHPSDDISMIEKAYKVASEAHKNQFRKSGEPYIIHPLNVAIILADLKLDKETIVAGILHDVVEDTVMTEEDLRREFGDDVALLVDGVTKLEKIPLSGSNGEQSDAKLEMQAENLRKMFLAMAKDIRVILVKLADRLHNMRTLQFKSEFKQKENGAVLMDDDLRKQVLTEWQNKKKEVITHPFLGEKVEWGMLPYVQAMLLARYLRGDLDAYPPFLWK